MMKKLALLAVVAALFVPCAFAESLAVQQTSTVAVTVAAEAGLTVPTNATLTESGNFFANYTGSSTFTYYVRTSATGSGNIQLQVTGDFTPANGPSVATSGTTGDLLTYVSSPVAPATAPVAQTASTSVATSVAGFVGGAHSAKGGNSGNAVNWTLVNDPAYATGSYTATVTWTISAA